MGFEQTDNHPVVNVTWDDATAFCKWLSKKEMKAYRLPTEAEWEYACRAGSTTRWCFGDNEKELTQYGYGQGWGVGTHAVGLKLPNPFGLFDVYGNTREWCFDWHVPQYYKLSPVKDPAGPSSGHARVLRGGAFSDTLWIDRSAHRSWSSPTEGHLSVGFRPAQTIPFGHLTLNVTEPNATVSIDNGQTILTTPDDTQPLETILAEGKHTIEVTKPGFRTFKKDINVVAGGLEMVAVRLEPLKPVVASTPPPAIAPFTPEQAKQHQQAWADHLGVPVEQDVDLGDGVKLTMMLIPPGEFLMGSSPEEQARFLEEAEEAGDQGAIYRIPTQGPLHRVRITRPFYLGKYEVTQAQWEAVMGSNPSSFTDSPSHPVEQVAGNHVEPFLTKLNESRNWQGMKFCLPTEAQWEYACRAGTTTAWYCGDSDVTLEEYAWFQVNSGGRTHPAGQLKPNGWGLYDMHGNVWEWCGDWHARDYYAQSPTEDPSGPPTGSSRVIRGGHWDHHARYCWSAIRSPHSPGFRHDYLGFRLASVLVDK